MKLRSIAIVALPLSLALTLGACSSSSDSAATDTTAETVSVDTTPIDSVAADTVAADTIPANAAFNAGDVTFAQGMIPHHQQAVEMATIALDPARNAGTAVKDLATRIQGAQDPEIQLMTGWLEEWGQTVDEMAGMDHSNMDMDDIADMPGMAGMMTADEMNALEAATGPAFDKLWLEMMVRHHQGAVTMSKTAETDGKAAVVKELAAKIVSAQEGEIAEMQKLLAA